LHADGAGIGGEQRAGRVDPDRPLTNVATLLLLYPHLKPKIRHIYLMGGGIDFGNWTPAAEFNILVDPEAAEVVFTSGIPITMAGLDVTEKALVFPEDFERVRAVGNPVAKVVAEWLDFFLRLPSQHRLPRRAGTRRGRGRGADPAEIMTMVDMYVSDRDHGRLLPRGNGRR
jgi:hypothetical protein